MKMDNLKNAFGSTPESVKQCVLRSLHEEPRREKAMKRKMTLSLAIALAVILALGCAAFAATRLEGIAGVFGFTNQETGETVVNEAVIRHIEALNEVYEGKAVRFTLTEGMYSPLNNYISMSWKLEPLAEGEEYYILCNEKVGGTWLEAGSLSNMSEFVLKGPAVGVRTGYLEGDGLEAELMFSILKLRGEQTYVYHGDDETNDEFFTRCEALIAEGKIPTAGDGLIEVRKIKDKTYAEELVIAGAADLVEEFTVSFDLGKIRPVDEYREYEGGKKFSFDAFDVEISRVVVTPGDSRFEFDILFDEEVTREEMEENAWAIHTAVEGMEFWMKAGYTRFTDPEKTADGRWKVSVIYETVLQTVYPEELILSITDYGADGNPIPLTGEGIRLKLTDK